MKIEGETFAIHHKGIDYFVIAMPFGPGYPIDISLVVTDRTASRRYPTTLNKLLGRSSQTLPEAALSEPMTRAHAWQIFVNYNLIELCVPHLD